MDRRDDSIQFLNVYEVTIEGAPRHLICFLDPILAGAKGIDHRWVVGEYTPKHDQSFDAVSFRLNPSFVESLTGYMNEVSSQSAEMIQEASEQTGGWLYVLDPRHREDPGNPDDPLAADLLGCFAVDESGQIVPNSFIYNANHRLFEEDLGVSGVFQDRRFYDWLHPRPETVK
jgi:hypothetical protein